MFCVPKNLSVFVKSILLNCGQLLLSDKEVDVSKELLLGKAMVIIRGYGETGVGCVWSAVSVYM